MSYDRVCTPVDCHTYEEDVEQRETTEMVSQSAILVVKNFVYIFTKNDDVDDVDDEDNPPQNDPSLL